MPDPIVCPHCHEQLEIPAEYHGRQVRCANCQNVFVATGGDVPVIPPRSRRPAEDAPPPWRDDRGPRRPRREEHEDDRPQRKSNIGVFALMLLTALTIGGCCGGVNLLMFAQMSPTMHPYPSAAGKFKVEFPDEHPTEGPITNPADETIEGVQVTADRPSAREHYTVRCYRLKPEWLKLDEYDALEKVADTELIALGVGVKVKDGGVKSERSTHAGFTALDVMTSKGTGLNQEETILRCILAGKRVYAVSAKGTQNFHLFWWVRQYFLSFEITDPNAKPPKKDDEPKKEKKQD